MVSIQSSHTYKFKVNYIQSSLNNAVKFSLLFQLIKHFLLKETKPSMILQLSFLLNEHVMTAGNIYLY